MYTLMHKNRIEVRHCSLYIDPRLLGLHAYHMMFFFKSQHNDVFKMEALQAFLKSIYILVISMLLCDISLV